MLSEMFQIFGNSYFTLFIYWTILLGSMSTCLEYNNWPVSISSTSCCCNKTEVPDDMKVNTTLLRLESSYECTFQFELSAYGPCSSNPCIEDYGDDYYCVSDVSAGRNDYKYACEPKGGIYLTSLFDTTADYVFCRNETCGSNITLDDVINTPIDNTKDECGTDVIVKATMPQITGRPITNSLLYVQMHICKYEGSYYIMGTEEEFYILSDGSCPGIFRSFEEHWEYNNCPNPVTRIPGISPTSFSSPTVNPSPVNVSRIPGTATTAAQGTSTTAATSVPADYGPAIAAGIGVVSIIVFVVAIVLVVVCCRRMSYRLKRNKKADAPPVRMEENSAYISVGGGIAAYPNNIPVYSKPMKGKHVIPSSAANGYHQPRDSAYEEAPAAKPRNSGYEEATLSPIRDLHNDIHSKPPATPPRPHSTARMSTPGDGYETTPSSDNFRTPLADSTGYEDNFVTPATAMTNSGYEDNFVTPAGGASGYEDNFVTLQNGNKESIRYDHLKRKIDLDGNDSKSEQTDERYGQVKPKPADSVKYQHLTHDKKPAPADPSYGRLDKERKS